MLSIGLDILLPEGVTLMTMIAMAQEAVPARLPKPYRQPSGPWQPARRHYDRRITCDTASRGPLRGSSRRGRGMFSRLRRSQDRLFVGGGASLRLAGFQQIYPQISKPSLSVSNSEALSAFSGIPPTAYASC